jgi:hypothetical protein
MCEHSQDGGSCLMKADLEIVKYLCKVGGKELMMLQDKAWFSGVSTCLNE